MAKMEQSRWAPASGAAVAAVPAAEEIGVVPAPVVLTMPRAAAAGLAAEEIALGR